MVTLFFKRYGGARSKSNENKQGALFTKSKIKYRMPKDRTELFDFLSKEFSQRGPIAVPKCCDLVSGWLFCKKSYRQHHDMIEKGYSKLE